MYRVNFYLRDPKAESDTTLNMFVTHNGDRIKLSTGLRLNPELWDSNKQKVTSNTKVLSKYSSKDPLLPKQIIYIKARISALREVVQDYHIGISLKKEPFSLSDLEDRIRAFLNPAAQRTIPNGDRVLDYLDDFIQGALSGRRKQVNGSNYSSGTIANYKNLRQTVQRFEKSYSVKLEWDKLDRGLYAKFMQWQEDEGFSVNYAGKHCKDLKSLMRLAYDDGVHENQAFRARWFAVPNVRPEKLPLTSTEMKALHNLELEPGSTLCKARDLFLIGCYTGLRISDVCRIRPEVFVENENGKLRIHLTNKKTKHPVRIPVSIKLHEVLQRYDYRSPKIAAQTANRLIKKIAMKAGIPEEKSSRLTMHIGRHSIITHLYQSGKVAMIDLMQISGHSTERSFMRYVNARPEDSAKRMEQVEWFK